MKSADVCAVVLLVSMKMLEDGSEFNQNSALNSNRRSSTRPSRSSRWKPVKKNSERLQTRASAGSLTSPSAALQLTLRSLMGYLLVPVEWSINLHL